MSINNNHIIIAFITNTVDYFKAFLTKAISIIIDLVSSTFRDTSIHFGVEDESRRTLYASIIDEVEAIFALAEGGDTDLVISALSMGGAGIL